MNTGIGNEQRTPEDPAPEQGDGPTGPPAAVILAAGLSGRMGTDKALLNHPRGGTFAEFLVSGYLLAGCDPVVLVVHPGIVSHAGTIPGALVVVNDDPGAGRGRSVRLGLAAVPSGRFCFLHNIDNPFLDDALAKKLLAAALPGHSTVPVYRDRGGHPVLLGTRVADEIRAATPDRVLREILSGYPRTEVDWPNPAILLNLNTPESYREFVSTCPRKGKIE